MKQSTDVVTAELPGLPKKIGRPKSACSSTSAQRGRKYRKAHDLVVVTSMVPRDLHKSFAVFAKARGLSVSMLVQMLMATLVDKSETDLRKTEREIALELFFKLQMDRPKN